MKSTRRGSDSPVHRREKTPRFQIPLDKWPVSPGTPREASGVPGIPSALIMAAFRASLKAEIRNNYAIRTIMAKVNSLMHESIEPGNYVTAFYGVLDSKKKIFT